MQEEAIFNSVNEMCNSLRSKSIFNDILYRYSCIQCNCLAALLNFTLTFGTMILSVLYLTNTIELNIKNGVIIVMLILVTAFFAKSYIKIAYKTLDNEYSNIIDDLVKSHIMRLNSYETLTQEQLQDIITNHISKVINNNL